MPSGLQLDKSPPLASFANDLENSRPPGTPPASDLPHPGFYLGFDEPLDWTKLARRFRVSGWSGPCSLGQNAEVPGALSKSKSPRE